MPSSSTGGPRPARKLRSQVDLPPPREELVLAYAAGSLQRGAAQLGVSMPRFQHWLRLAGIAVGSYRPHRAAPPPAPAPSIPCDRLTKAERAAWQAHGGTVSQLVEWSGLPVEQVERAVRGQWVAVAAITILRTVGVGLRP